MSENTENTDTTENTKNISKEFTDNVVQWVKFDDELRNLRSKTKEITTEKAELEKSILEYLDKIGEKAISIGDGNLRKNISKTKGPLKKEHIQATIKDLTKDEGKATLITNQIFDNRPLSERVNLKRTKNRGPKVQKDNL